MINPDPGSGRLRSLSLRMRMLFGTATLAVLVSVAFVGLIVSTNRLKTASGLRAHSELVIASANESEKLLLDLETGERGFMITGVPGFLGPWRSALDAFPAATARLAQLVADNPGQERIARAIRAAGASYIRGWSTPLIRIQRRDPAAARRLVAGGQGKREVDALRRRFTRLIDNEQALAVKRTSDANGSASRAQAFGIGGLAVSLALIAAFAIVLIRSIARPLARLGAATGQIAAGDLAARAKPGGPSEIAELVGSFNAMAEALQHGHGELVAATDRADSASVAKSEFLSRMSHELRTPLNAVIGFGQLLELDQLDERQHEHIEHILKAGRHLLELINEVLEISRIEAGQLALSPEAVPLRETVREVLALVTPLAAQRDVHLNADMTGLQEDGHVHADRQRLRQVLLNLLSNAIKYNRAGGRVDVSFQRTETGTVRTVVADTGIGIESRQLARAFEPFDRLGAEGSDVEGTGLGLTLSKRLVEAMNGSITVESELGHGTTFIVELNSADAPQVEQDAQQPSRDASLKSRIDPGATGQRLLYIEDNVSNLTLVERILERQPAVELIPAMQGSLGLDLAREHHPDLILLDLHLPDMAGDEVLRRLQADPSTRHIPVVVLSADANKRQSERLLHLGASNYLTKPLDIQRFLEVIAANLNAKEE